MAHSQKSRDRLVGHLIVLIPVIAVLVVIRRAQAASESNAADPR